MPLLSKRLAMPGCWSSRERALSSPWRKSCSHASVILPMAPSSALSPATPLGPVPNPLGQGAHPQDSGELSFATPDSASSEGGWSGWMVFFYDGRCPCGTVWLEWCVGGWCWHRRTMCQRGSAAMWSEWSVCKQWCLHQIDRCQDDGAPQLYKRKAL